MLLTKAGVVVVSELSEMLGHDDNEPKDKTKKGGWSQAARDKAAAALRKITLQVGCLWDNPQVWFASVQTKRKAVATATFHRVLARSAQEAAELAALDYELPITVWVKSEAQEQAIAIEVAE
jgi:hypothetical protein